MKHLFTLIASIVCVVFVIVSPDELKSSISSSKNTGEQAEHDDRTEKQQERIAKRHAKQAEYEKSIDSIILSHNYRFIPTSFQVEPAGSMHPINNASFELSVYSDYADIYLPYLRGMMPPYKLVLINNIINSLNGYTAIQTDNGWTISFTSWLYSANSYMFTLDVYKTTGSAQLSIASNYYSTVTYWGSIMKVY